MGFPFPTTDYSELRINLINIWVPNPVNIIRVDAPEGFVLVDHSLKTERQDGEGLEGVIVFEKVIALIIAIYEPLRPVI